MSFYFHYGFTLIIQISEEQSKNIKTLFKKVIGKRERSDMEVFILITVV